MIPMHILEYWGKNGPFYIHATGNLILPPVSQVGAWTAHQQLHVLLGMPGGGGTGRADRGVDAAAR